MVFEIHVWPAFQELRLGDLNHVGMLGEEDLKTRSRRCLLSLAAYYANLDTSTDSFLPLRVSIADYLLVVLFDALYASKW